MFFGKCASKRDLHDNNNILAIFKDLPGTQNNRYNPVIRLKSFVNTFYVNI